MSAMAGMIAVGRACRPSKPDDGKDQAADQELPPGKQDAVMLAREDANEAGRKGTRDGGGQDKALAVERKAKGTVRARKVDERDAGKAQHTASTLAASSFSVRNARAAKRMARKLALASMMELDMALARESPR